MQTANLMHEGIALIRRRRAHLFRLRRTPIYSTTTLLTILFTFNMYTPLGKPRTETVCFPLAVLNHSSSTPCPIRLKICKWLRPLLKASFLDASRLE